MHKKKLDTIFFCSKVQITAYRFNHFQNSIGEPLIKIRHSLITDNYLAAEEIQIKIGNILLNVL